MGMLRTSAAIEQEMRREFESHTPLEQIQLFDALVASGTRPWEWWFNVLLGDPEPMNLHSNATPAVAAAARWHVGDVADEGVTVAIEEITRAVRTGETPAFMRQEAPYASAESAPEEEEEDADDDAMGEAIRANTR